MAKPNLFTDGVYINAVFTPKDKSSAKVISCSLMSGDIVETPLNGEVKRCSKFILPLIEQVTTNVLKSKMYSDILLSFTSNLLQYASIVDLQSYASFNTELHDLSDSAFHAKSSKKHLIRTTTISIQLIIMIFQVPLN